MRSKRGAVLIVVLGILMVLSVLAITFAQVSTLDRSVARTYLDNVRAQLIARTGIERVLVEINNAIERGAWNDPAMQYWGGNVSRTGSPDVSVPLHFAACPSYPLADGDPLKADGRPLEFTIDGIRAGLSGTFKDTSSHAGHGDVYKLRVVDANSMLHVNDGLAGGNKGNVSLNLKRLLDLLGRQVGVPDAGQRLVDKRPPGGYRSKHDLEAVLGAADFQRLRNYVTTLAWVDDKVVNPVPLSQETLDAYPVRYNSDIGTYRYGRSRNADGGDIAMPMKFAPDFCDAQGIEHTVMAMDELNAQWIERTSRAPVNVNAAAKPVLVALLTGLRGFFVAERRKSNPGEQDMYKLLWYEKAEFAPGGRRGDEYGYLYSTPMISGPEDHAQGGTSAGEAADSPTLSAEAIADELIACRSRQSSPKSGINYGTIWYGGPFKTWRQFNAFCDGLIDRLGFGVSFNASDPDLGNGALLRDPRKGLYFDYMPSFGTSGCNGSDSVSASVVMPIYAAQAVADVLKANFNPNCTLNELNPDENLFTVVDKTDLLCNSTEFCFTPMGYFEVESEGLIVETPGGEDLMSTRSGKTVATKTITCLLKAYDVHRDTTQADFYDGDAGFRPGHMPVTNNNKTIELGPEPDNGLLAAECRWSGWMQLSTVGGDWRAPGVGKERRTLQPTESGNPEHGETVHAHFTRDQDLGYHAGGDSRAFRGAILKNQQCRNNPDRTETEPGPYGPTRGKPGQYREARDWSRAEHPGTTGFAYSAPSDLRVDGDYVERDASVMWKNSLDAFSILGTAAFWVKPSFQPCLTGSARTWFSCDTYNVGKRTNPTGNQQQQKTCAVWFLAAHDRPPFQDPVNEWMFPTYNPGPWRPASLLLGTSEGFGGIGSWTPSLNHRAHLDHHLTDLLKAHGWTHVEANWDMSANTTMLWINGELQSYSSGVTVHPDNWSSDEFLQHDNPIRFGEPSKTWEFDTFWNRQGRFSRNWTADATFDEFYLWKGNALARSQDIYTAGRYTRPLPGYEASYTSKPLAFAAPSRNLPPPSNTAAPPVASTGDGSPIPGGKPPQIPTTQALPPGQARIIAAFITMYPEVHSKDGVPLLADHGGGIDGKFAPKSEPLRIETELDFIVNKRARNRFTTGDGGPVENLVVSTTDEVKYFLRIRTPQATVDSILHGTPVIDDVTIFHTRGPEFLSYEIQDTSL